MQIMAAHRLLVRPQTCAACGAACAKSLQCGKCGTLYCGAACQKAHWKAGHKTACATVALFGVEQFCADWAAAEAANDAAEESEAAAGACSATCGLCRDERKRDDLVRGCRGCVGADGFAHPACLVRGAVVATEGRNALGRWSACVRCGGEFEGRVRLMLARECWRTYCPRPEGDPTRAFAMNLLGNALYETGRLAESVPCREARVPAASSIFFK